ncbi:MAG TPA: branched-chain amino acid ABC transporter permease, partial [Gammaproteobacteria bacterium]|nr:branched-chain amino acid ABC transporter permease [Gammaproteobacteria bacterium]
MSTRSLVTRYEDDQALFPDVWHKVGLVAGGLFLLLFLALADNQWLTIANVTLVTIVGAIGLTIVTGFTGQISLGHAAFLAVGASTAGIGSSRFGLPFRVLLPLAGCLAALVGLAVGPFALRLKGLYLAIITMGLVFIVNHLLLSFPARDRRRRRRDVRVSTAVHHDRSAVHPDDEHRIHSDHRHRRNWHGVWRRGRRRGLYGRRAGF